MNRHSLISIVVPVYKVEQYLRECLESIISQTYRNIEIILVDDCSPDSCGSICDKYALSDSRIKVIHKCVNEGLSAARNTGIENSSGEYIGFVDSDDLLFRDSIERLSRGIMHNADLICGDYKMYDSSDRKVCGYYLETGLISGNSQIRGAFLRDRYNMQAWGKLVKKSFLFENKLFFLKDLVHEDDLWSFLLAMKAESLYSVNEPVYIHRCRPGSIITDMSQKTEIHSRLWILLEISKSCSETIIHDKTLFEFYLKRRDRILFKMSQYDDSRFVDREFISMYKALQYDVIKSLKNGLISRRLFVRDIYCLMPSRIALYFWRTMNYCRRFIA